MEDVLGWTKLTVSAAAILKVLQLRARFWLDWLTVIDWPLWAMGPEPGATWPPEGKASGVPATATADSRTAAVMAVRSRPPRAPPFRRALAVSAAATQALRRVLKTRR